ncbi:MAG: hypothetical protein ACE5HC_07895 [Candidatus Binatia bacterium]
MLLFAAAFYPVLVLIEPYDQTTRNWVFFITITLLGTVFLLDNIHQYLQHTNLPNSNGSLTGRGRFLELVRGYSAYVKGKDF